MYKILFSSCVTPSVFNPNRDNIFCIELFLCPTLQKNNYQVTMTYLGRSWIEGVIKELLLKRAVLMLGQLWFHHQRTTCLFSLFVKQDLHKVGTFSMFGLYFAAPFPVILIITLLDPAKLTGDNTTELSHVSNRLDETSADQDRWDFFFMLATLSYLVLIYSIIYLCNRHPNLYVT